MIMKDFTKQIKEYYDIEIEALKRLDAEEISKAMNVIHQCYLDGGNIYIFGNGGSAATASHMACDFNKGLNFYIEKKINVISLSDNLPTITAIANDMDYSEIYVFQLRGKLQKKDILIPISGSGNSKNIVKAVEYGKELGCNIIAVTGYDGGIVDRLANYHMHAPINDMMKAEDIHMSFDHMIMTILLDFFAQEKNK